MPEAILETTEATETAEAPVKETGRTSTDWFRTMKSGNVPKATSKRIDAPATNRTTEGAKAIPGKTTTATPVKSAAPEVSAAQATQQATTETPLQEENKGPKRIVIDDPNTIIVGPNGEVSLKGAEFFNYKKENWDKGADAIRRKDIELSNREKSLAERINTPILRTYDAIRQANPSWTDAQCEDATFKALGKQVANGQTDSPKQSARPIRPAEPDEMATAEVFSKYQKDLAKYETEHDDWLIAETQKPMKELSEREAQKERARQESDRQSAEIIGHNKEVLDARWGHLPFDARNANQEQIDEIDRRIIARAERFGIYLDKQSVGQNKIDPDKFQLIVESEFPYGTAMPGTNPSEILGKALEAEIPLVQKAQPKPPPKPGLQKAQSIGTPTAAQQRAGKKDDWWNKLQGKGE